MVHVRATWDQCKTMKEKKKIRIITTTAVNGKEKTLFVPGSSSNNRSMRIEFCYKLNLLKGSFIFKFKEEKKNIKRKTESTS